MEPVIVEPGAPVGTEPTDINAVDGRGQGNSDRPGEEAIGTRREHEQLDGRDHHQHARDTEQDGESAKDWARAALGPHGRASR